MAGIAYQGDIVWADANRTQIKVTRLRLYHTVLRTQQDYIDAMKAAYAIQDMVPVEVFPYSVFYIFFEQYLSIVRIATENVGLACGMLNNPSLSPTTPSSLRHTNPQH